MSVLSFVTEGLYHAHLFNCQQIDSLHVIAQFSKITESVLGSSSAVSNAKMVNTAIYACCNGLLHVCILSGTT